MPEYEHPGVYIEEVPSGVHTILGVATSITAFIGRAKAGPVDLAVELAGFGDYERRFGCLEAASPMGYAVRDFYLNGGSTAVVVRVAHDNARVATITLDGDSEFVLEAASPGEWGNGLSAAVEYEADDAQGFTLTVRYRAQADGNDIAVESFSAVSTVEADPRFLPRLLEQGSSLVRLRDGAVRPTRPRETVTGDNGVRVVNWVDADANSGSDGSDIDDRDVIGDPQRQTGIHALERIDVFNLLCIPPRIRNLNTEPPTYAATSAAVYQAAVAFCVERRAVLIVDPDPAWAASSDEAVANAIAGRNALNLGGTAARNAALYFPCMRAADPARDGRIETFVPSGAVAGIIARSDATRGVWKSPAGADAALAGIQGLQVNLSDVQNGALQPLGVNCLRSFGDRGPIVWGARTLADDGEYKYLAVRRLALFLEESISRGTHWVAFEPNEEQTWAQARLSVGAFMDGLFRQGAFQGATPRDAYFVKCDRSTMTQADIDSGNLIVVVGFAALRPAEFVVISLGLLTGQCPK